MSVHWNADADATTARLIRTSRDGRPGAANPGVLEDYADVAEGLLTLYAVTGETRWFTHAGQLLDVVLDVFVEPDGTFFDTASDAEALIFRPADPSDSATPSGSAAAAGALVTYAALTGSSRHRAAAERALSFPAALAARAPRFAGWGLAVAEALVDGPREVAVVGDPDAPETRALHLRALRSTAPGLVLALGAAAPSRPTTAANRPASTGNQLPNFYAIARFSTASRPHMSVEDSSCQAPTTDPAELGRQLDAD